MTTTDGTIKRLTDRGFGFVVTSSARLYRTLRLSRFLPGDRSCSFPSLLDRLCRSARTIT